LTGMPFMLTSSYNCLEVITPLGGSYFSRKLLNERETVGLLSVVLTSNGIISPWSSIIKFTSALDFVRQ